MMIETVRAKRLPNRIVSETIIGNAKFLILKSCIDEMLDYIVRKYGYSVGKWHQIQSKYFNALEEAEEYITSHTIIKEDNNYDNL